jgi:hypothetical protein
MKHIIIPLLNVDVPEHPGDRGGVDQSADPIQTMLFAHEATVDIPGPRFSFSLKKKKAPVNAT